MELDKERKDAQRDKYLKNKGLSVLRFKNLQVLQELDSVMEVIYQAVKERL
jgi:very-short-patch-repair endonuclease